MNRVNSVLSHLVWMHGRYGNLGVVVVLPVERGNRKGTDHVLGTTVQVQIMKNKHVTMTPVQQLGSIGVIGLAVVLLVEKEYSKDLELAVG